ncbi:MAG: flagellar hook-length control protein FliK, partial [Proteobacteria bacterium]|nr:flagellar hook-length control protein FliK [Pseudomonadota bacterium]
AAAASDFSRSLQRATPPLLGEQVAFQVKAAMSSGTSKIRIQLDPAELGKIDIKLTVEAGGKTGVTIMVDNRHTLDMLQRDSQGLARALADAGLSTDSSSLSFNLRGEGQQQQGQGENAHAASTYRKAQPDDEIVEPLRTATPQSYVVNLAEGLDIQI